MTKAELIDFLNKNFADGEEVTFLYDDDGYGTRGVVKGVEMNTKEKGHRYIEVLENGKWVEYKGDCHVTYDEEYCKKWGHKVYGRGYLGSRDDSWWRETWIRDGEDTKKCVVIT